MGRGGLERCVVLALLEGNHAEIEVGAGEVGLELGQNLEVSACGVEAARVCQNQAEGVARLQVLGREGEHVFEDRHCRLALAVLEEQTAERPQHVAVLGRLLRDPVGVVERVLDVALIEQCTAQIEFGRGRRRVEQYGPRLTKPYTFYDWVETAKAEIRARGEKPVELSVLPTGSELVQPSKRFTADQRDVQPLDPKGRIQRDTKGLILTEVTVVPPRVRPGESARVHVSLRPNPARKAHWNNEAEPLRLWVEAPSGWELERRLLTAPQGGMPETSEPRQFELDIRAPADAQGTAKLRAYALYYVCEDVGGTCLFLRQDVSIEVPVERNIDDSATPHG